MTKKEKFFIAGIFCTALILGAGMTLFRKDNYADIRITVDGQEYGTYSLSKDRVISINDTNVCEIKDGQVTMIQADCPDHLCMKQKPIGSKGGSIVCLPNKVVIEGENCTPSGPDSPEIDAVA